MSESVKALSGLDLTEMAKAEETLAKDGINLADVVNKLFREINEYGGAPFFYYEDKGFNKETLEAIQEGEDILSGKKEAKKYDSVDELFADLLKD